MLSNLSPCPVSLFLCATSVSCDHLLFKQLTLELLFQGLLVWGRVWGTQTKILLHVLIYFLFSHIFLISESGEELKSCLMKVKEESEKSGLKLNIQKRKIMASSPITAWQIDGKTKETVKDFIFLGSKITADADCSHKIKRHLLLGRKATANLVQSSSVAQLCPTLCDPMNCSTPGLPAHHQLPESTQTHVH